MAEKPTALPPVNEGSDGVINFNDKTRAYLRLATEHAQRAAKIDGDFSKSCEKYRELAIEINVPSRWRPRPPGQILDETNGGLGVAHFAGGWVRPGTPPQTVQTRSDRGVLLRSSFERNRAVLNPWSGKQSIMGSTS